MTGAVLGMNAATQNSIGANSSQVNSLDRNNDSVELLNIQSCSGMRYIYLVFEQFIVGPDLCTQTQQPKGRRY